MNRFLEIIAKILNIGMPSNGINVDLANGDFNLGGKPFTFQSHTAGAIKVSYNKENRVVNVIGLVGQYHPQQVTSLRDTDSVVRLFTIFPA